MSSPRPTENLRRWLLAVGCAGVLGFFFSPAWAAFSLWSRVPEMDGLLEVRRAASVLAQVDAPGAAIADPLHRVIQWRLLFPLLGRLLHLPPFLLFGLAHVGCLLVLALLVSRLRREGLAWIATGGAAVLLGAASWFFAATGWLGYYDSWLALALLTVAFGRTSATAWLACVWAPWVDERFVLAAPLAFLCRWAWQSTGAPAPSAPPPAALAFWNEPGRRREIIIAGALLLGFVVVRLGILGSRTAEGATVASYLGARDYLGAPFPRILLGLWEGLRGGWLLVATALVLLAPSAGWCLALAATAAATAALGLATAQDYSRALTMLLPVAALGALLAARRRVAWFPRLLSVGAPLALLLPAHHVMSDRVNPVFYLYHELNALRHPPPAAMPELYELRAIDHMERGDFAAAASDLDLAIRLSPAPVSPRKHRGLLRAGQGRWTEARADFTTMVELAPDDPEAWFLRAQSQFALGDRSAAAADFRQALAVAPPGWTDRADVKRFQVSLGQGNR